MPSTPRCSPLRRVVVTVADWIADPDGLFVADFDLLTRLPGLEALDLVATDRPARIRFHQRLHDWLPGLEEVGRGRARLARLSRPRLIVRARPGGRRAASGSPIAIAKKN